MTNDTIIARDFMAGLENFRPWFGNANLDFKEQTYENPKYQSPKAQRKPKSQNRTMCKGVVVSRWYSVVQNGTITKSFCFVQFSGAP
jgi:hypothetical protein